MPTCAAESWATGPNAAVRVRPTSDRTELRRADRQPHREGWQSRPTRRQLRAVHQHTYVGLVGLATGLADREMERRRPSRPPPCGRNARVDRPNAASTTIASTMAHRTEIVSDQPDVTLHALVDPLVNGHLHSVSAGTVLPFVRGGAGRWRVAAMTRHAADLTAVGANPI